jgi:hypothetical protein
MVTGIGLLDETGAAPAPHDEYPTTLLTWIAVAPAEAAVCMVPLCRTALRESHNDVLYWTAISIPMWTTVLSAIEKDIPEL